MLRPALLFLSRQPWLRTWMEQSARSRRLTSRFVAGSSLDQALAVIDSLSNQGIFATLDLLGENVTSADEALRYVDAYRGVLARSNGVNANTTVSLKPTQFGMDLSETQCLKNVETLLQGSADTRSIEVDMESSMYTDRTLALVRSLHQHYPGRVRAVIQAYLRRSESDIDALSEAGVRVRLCKGAYKEDRSVAFARKTEVDENYLRLGRRLLDSGTDPALATHDPAMITALGRYATEKAVAKDRFEFQMLYGIRRDLQTRLVADGYRLRLYVPFGNAWFPYFMRRLAERPANLLFLGRNLLRQ
jgi:proline dehydrogenase